MSVDSINSAAASAYIATQTSTSSSKAGITPGQPSVHEGVKIADMINLSFEANRFTLSDLTDEQRAMFQGWKDRIAENELKHQYSQEQRKFNDDKREKFETIHDKFIKGANGLLYGCAFSSDDPSKPITTTSGDPHPFAEQIREYLMDHRSELDQMNALTKQEFMTFDEWKAART